jgi:hypothetical protein
MLSILLLSSLLASSLTVTPSKAADYSKVGVKVGDWAYYSAAFRATGSVQPPPYSPFYINLTITKIDRCNVTFSMVGYAANGTHAVIGSASGNISDGTPLETGGYLCMFLVVPNLWKAEPIYIGSPLSINDTGTMASCGDLRVFVHGNGTLSLFGFSFALDCRWDQATGIAMHENLIATAPGGTAEWTLTLVSTSLWSPSPAPTLDHPSVVSYAYGTTGHNITWHPSSPHPQSYTLRRNGTVVSSGNWNGSALVYSVDGLGIGTYLFNCTVTDGLGRSISSVVTVTVSAAPLPVAIMVAVGGGIAVVIVLAAIVMLRRRRV